MKIFEGGNAAWLNRETGEEVGRAEQIDLNAFPRNVLTSSFKGMLKNLSDLYAQKYGEPLWQDFSVIETGKAFSGSSYAMFNDEIPDEEFVQHKPLVGDMDLTINKDKNNNLWELLLELEGTKLYDENGVSITYLGNNKPKAPGASQINSVFDFFSPEGNVKVQVDFEPVDYEEGSPTEWAKFSHSSSWEDIKQGIKGVAHKYALTNLARIISSKEDILVATEKSYEKYLANDYDEGYLTIKQTGGENITKAAALTFAVASGKGGGMRWKLIPAEDETGQQLEIDGSPVWVEIAAKSDKANYQKSIAEMFKMLFGAEPQPEDLNKMQSFVGIVDLINKYMDVENKRKFVDAMVDYSAQSLFHNKDRGTRVTRSQELYRDAPEKDKEVKMAIVDKMFELMPDIADMRQWVDEKAEEYYQGYGRNKRDIATEDSLSAILEDRRYTFSQFWSKNNG